MRGESASTGGELAGGLALLSADISPSVQAVVPGLLRRLRADAVAAFGLEAGAEGCRLSFAYASSPLLEIGRPRMEQLLRVHPRDFGAFDPVVPEARQRNAPLTRADLGADAFEALPAVRELYPACGLAGTDMLRVLVCEDSVLLAWVGAFRREPFTRDERRWLGELVPTLRRRLCIEHQLSGLPVAAAAIAAAVEAMASPAFLLRDPAAVVYANAPGRALLERDRPGVTAQLEAAADGVNGGAARFAAMRLQTPAGHSLVVQREAPVSVETRIAAAGARWSLTRRQAEVLARVASGASNKAVAGALGCAERTVELHVTALLEKARCENRVELVAKFWREI